MEITLNIFCFIICSLCIFCICRKKSSQIKFFALLLFCIKVFVGITIFYTVSSENSINNSSIYFQESKELYNTFKENSNLLWKFVFDGRVCEIKDFAFKYITNYEVYNDKINFIRFNLFLLFVSGGSYIMHFILFCFFSTLGITLFYLGLLRFLKHAKIRISLLLFFIPSVLYWTSGVNIEALLFFGIGLLMNGILSLANVEYNIKTLIKIIVGFFVLLLFNQIILLSLSVPLICFLICFYDDKKSKIKVYGSTVCLILIIFVFFEKPIVFLSLKQHHFFEFNNNLIVNDENKRTFYFIPISEKKNVTLSDEKAIILDTLLCKKIKYVSSTFTFDTLLPSNKKLRIMKSTKINQYNFEMSKMDYDKWIMFKNLPYSLRNVMFRPFPWKEGFSFYKFILFVEHVFFFFLLLFAWRFRIKNQERVIKNAITFMLFFVSILYSFIGQVVSNSMVISQYKSIGIMVLCGVIVLLLFGHYKRNSIYE